jgi:hypothetical protein
VRDVGKGRAEAASGITGRREILRPPRTSQDSNSTIRQVQTDRPDQPYRGEIVPKEIATMPKSRMLLSSHCELLEVPMEVEGVVLDLLIEVLVGAKMTTCPDSFIGHRSGRLPARPTHIPSAPIPKVKQRH